ncbi:aspartyl protease family protein [Chitinophagaceae bacterium MMS25-I14]
MNHTFMNKGHYSLYFLLFLLFPMYGFAAPSVQAPGFSFQYYQSLIYVKVKINNKPGLVFLLNTGANTSAISTTTADILKLPVISADSVEGTVGKEAVKIMKAARVQVGDARVENMEITRRDLSKWMSPEHRAVDGILGTDFLKQFYVTIDYKNKKLLMGAKIPSVKYLHSFPFIMNDGIPQTEISLNDTLVVPVRFNTGVSLTPNRDIFVNISFNSWRKLKMTDRSLQPKQYFTGTAVGGNVYLPVVQIKTMQIGNFTVKLPFVIVQPEEGYFKSPDAVGFMGNNFLEKFEKICFDFHDHTILFNIPKARSANIVVNKPLPVVSKQIKRR